MLLVQLAFWSWKKSLSLGERACWCAPRKRSNYSALINSPSCCWIRLLSRADFCRKFLSCFTLTVLSLRCFFQQFKAALHLDVSLNWAIHSGLLRWPGIPQVTFTCARKRTKTSLQYFLEEFRRRPLTLWTSDCAIQDYGALELDGAYLETEASSEAKTAVDAKDVLQQFILEQNLGPAKIYIRCGWRAACCPIGYCDWSLMSLTGRINDGTIPVNQSKCLETTKRFRLCPWEVDQQATVRFVQN